MARKKIEIGQDLVKMSSDELAKQLVILYKNFDKNRQKMCNEINNFITKMELNKALEVHASNSNYTLLNPELEYFIEGHALINRIRTLLGQEEVTFNLGIVDETKNVAYRIPMSEDEVAKLMRTRGSDKVSLSHSQETVDNLLSQYEDQLKEFDITETYNKFINILKKKTEEKGTNLNYGYAFEAYGHFEFGNEKFTRTRHDTYYNYYRASRKNTQAWTTGGDVGNIQYKLIRIYTDKSGKKQISSASVTSAKTILKELNLLKKILSENNTMQPEQISLKLAKEFTQLNVPKKLDDNFKNLLCETFISAGAKEVIIS